LLTKRNDVAATAARRVNACLPSDCNTLTLAGVYVDHTVFAFHCRALCGSAFSRARRYCCRVCPAPGRITTETPRSELLALSHICRVLQYELQSGCEKRRAVPSAMATSLANQLESSRSLLRCHAMHDPTPATLTV
jgi:hypothetical protein